MTRFVILAAPRTGSNLLCTLLNSHSDIVCHHELFNPRGIFYAVDRRDGSIDLGDVGERDRDPAGFLDRVWQASSGVASVGFKMTKGQDESIIRALLADTGVCKILLRRRNRLKTYVSQLVAEQTDQWEVYAGSALRSPDAKPRIQPAQLYAHAADTARFYSELQDGMQGSCVEVAYEDLFCASESERLLRALDVVTDATLRPVSVKQNPCDLRDAIENFDELDMALKDTEYHDELHDNGN